MENELYSVNAIYLGASKVDALVFDNAIDGLQDVLLKSMPEGVESVNGHQVLLVVTTDGLKIQYAGATRSDLFLPMKYLIYCGAIRKMRREPGMRREFETINRITDESKMLDPPLFVAVFKGIGNYICHVFAVRSDQDALRCVNTMMKSYYESEDAKQINEPQQISNMHSAPVHHESIPILNPIPVRPMAEHRPFHETPVRPMAEHRSIHETPIRSMPEHRPIHEQHFQHSTLQQVPNFNAMMSSLQNRAEERFTVRTSNGDILTDEQIAQDPDIQRALQMAREISSTANQTPDRIQNVSFGTAGLGNTVFINKPNEQDVVSKQNVIIRWIEPPTPPLSGPIIVREMQDPPCQQSAPPIIIREEAQPQCPVPPVIFKENPPCTYMQEFSQQPVVCPQQSIICPQQPVVCPPQPVVCPPQPVVCPQQPVICPPQSIIYPQQPVVCPPSEPPNPVIQQFINPQSSFTPQVDKPPQTIIIERWLPSCDQTAKIDKHTKPQKCVIPINVKEVKMIQPKPIVVKQLRPVYGVKQKVIQQPGYRIVRHVGPSTSSVHLPMNNTQNIHYGIPSYDSIAPVTHHSTADSHIAYSQPQYPSRARSTKPQRVTFSQHPSVSMPIKA